MEKTVVKKDKLLLMEDVVQVMTVVLKKMKLSMKRVENVSLSVTVKDVVNMTAAMN